MNQKRDLLREITGCPDSSEAPFVLNSDSILESVLNRSDSASERKLKMTKSQRWKTILVAIAAVMVLTAGAYAANGKITSVFSSGPSISDPTYRTLPSEQQCLEDAGFVPVLLECLRTDILSCMGRLFPIGSWTRTTCRLKNTDRLAFYTGRTKTKCISSRKFILLK